MPLERVRSAALPEPPSSSIRASDELPLEPDRTRRARRACGARGTPLPLLALLALLPLLPSAAPVAFLALVTLSTPRTPSQEVLAGPTERRDVVGVRDAHLPGLWSHTSMNQPLRVRDLGFGHTTGRHHEGDDRQQGSGRGQPNTGLQPGKHSASGSFEVVPAMLTTSPDERAPGGSAAAVGDARTRSKRIIARPRSWSALDSRGATGLDVCPSTGCHPRVAYRHAPTYRS